MVYTISMSATQTKEQALDFAPTNEQQAILDAFATGKNLVIEAGAGTGKTSTLRMLGESDPDRNGLFIAYNKAIQTDAARDFPTNVACKTAHSLAYAGMMQNADLKPLMSRLNGPRVPSKQVMAILGISSYGYQITKDQQVPGWIIARSVMDTVRRFCNSASTSVEDKHVPKIDGVEDKHQGAYKAHAAPFARKAWDDINSSVGRLKFEHDHYLKIWALTSPVLKSYQFVLLDEAQDANPVIAKLVEDQVHAQQIMVGDACQAIYGWRGAIDAMSNFDCDQRLSLSQSFRFGQAVADTANIFLNLLDAPLRLSGFEKIDSKVERVADPDAILCRTNATVIEQAMAAQGAGRKVAIVGGTSDIKRFMEAAQDLMSGKSTSHPELALFKTWSDVLEYTNSDEGADLKVMVRLIDVYGIPAILEVCRTSVEEDSADLIVSTAHRAKGREWNKVRIANDFKAPEEGKEVSRSELMLMYVACTRAQLVLDKSGVAWIDIYQTEGVTA